MTKQFAVTLPIDMAEAVESKVKSGEYASASEVIRDSLQVLLGQDAAIESWLRNEVLEGHREYLADPSKAVSAEDLLARLSARKASQHRE